MLGTSDLAVAAAAASVPGLKLNDGNVIPQIGLGLLRIENDDVAPVVKSALAAGYRHIDGAAGYNNEGGVGRALAETGFNKGRKRSHLWVTTKLRDSEQGYDMALAAFDRQLGLLQLEYVDMYMIHWPTPFNWRSGATWKAFTKLRDEGRVKTLGVCNFLPEHLTRLYEETGEWPAVNQIELHPTWQQREVVAFCKEHGIAVEAYSPMARGADLKAGNGTIARIAASRCAFSTRSCRSSGAHRASAGASSRHSLGAMACRRARFRASLFHRRYASEKNSARGLDAQSSATRASSARRKTCW